MESATIIPQKHIFVCCNDRGTEKACCMNVQGMEFFRELKQFVAEQGLIGKVFVTKTGCLGYCSDEGSNLVLYPENKWYIHVKPEELKKIKEDILKGL
ncbi:TPA: (2Fe-2S) ferredoxin domain-containing protein [Candidatus Woesearchaeota archaeon]|nr:(2Fe-2S) ferredoxin domain-containing protein [Candidatus Woesearchaeota archaeon]